MPHPQIIPAILSGGAGTRLWPVSTEAQPKQFHAFGARRTLFQETIARVRAEDGFVAPMILCNAAHEALVAAQLEEIGARAGAIVLEPVGRNTAAAAAIAAGLAREIAPGALVLLMPADHVIADRPAFLDVVRRAREAARTHIVTFGIEPKGPETGYGYIQAGGEIAPGVNAIARFHEKPDEARARTFIAAGGCYWNAGIFLFDPEVLLRECAGAPDIRDGALAALRAADRSGVVIRLPRDEMARTPSAPLDIAVMEKSSFGAVAPCDIGWADLGSWSEIWRIAPKDSEGNAVTGDLIAHDARGNLIRSDGPRIALAGVSDLIVIAEGDTILIAPRARAQDVKILCELARRADRR